MKEDFFLLKQETKKINDLFFILSASHFVKANSPISATQDFIWSRTKV